MSLGLRSLLVLVVTVLAMWTPGVAQTQVQPLPAPGTHILSTEAAQKYATLAGTLQQLDIEQQLYLTAKTPAEKSAIEAVIQALLEQVVRLAKDLQVTMSNNPYVDVPGFSMRVGPPGLQFTMQFNFKKPK